jgi:hypothetical protein
MQQKPFCDEKCYIGQMIWIRIWIWRKVALRTEFQINLRPFLVTRLAVTAFQIQRLATNKL